MRIALDGIDEIAARVARVLFAENSVDHIGFLQPDLPLLGKRTSRTGQLDTYDVLVSTGETAATELLAQASVRDVPLVLWHDEPGLHRGSSTIPVVAGANVGSALAPSLVHHPSAAVSKSDTVTIAWTEPGKPFRRGEPVTFPEPVGPVWARQRTTGQLVARTSENWSGAVVTVRGPAGERIVGVSDHGAHLEALTLAAVVLLTAEGTYDPRICEASERSPDVLKRAMDLELDVAVWTSA